MSTSDFPSLPATPSAPPNRRQFLGRVGGATAGVIAIGAIGLEPLLGSKRSEVEAHEILPVTPSDRTEQSKTVRKTAADNEKALGVFEHPCNGDEELYPNRIGNFHKTLPHDPIGEVNQAAYNALLDALQTGNIEDFENVPRGGTAGYLNPLGGLAFQHGGA